MSEIEETLRGIAVIGACGSGLENVARLLGELAGAPVTVTTPEGSHGSVLGELNEHLLGLAGGSWTAPPNVSPIELARMVAPQRQRARRIIDEVLGTSTASAADPARMPWVWADPRLTFLLPFWMDALDVSPLVVWAIREPAEAAGESERRRLVAAGSGGVLWERYNRAALSVSQGLETLIVSHETLGSRSSEGLERVATFLSNHGFPGLDRSALAQEASTRNGDAGVRLPPRSIEDPEEAAPLIDGDDQREQDALYDLLLSLERGGSDVVRAVGEATAAYYDEDYYRSYGSPTGLGYTRDDPSWIRFFDSIAAEIASGLNPRKVLDVGCAIGMLVEALRNHGVDATGVDISSWAIKQVPDDIRPYCSVGSILEPFSDRYDLITCIEVLEHLPPLMARPAVANLCAHADRVMISSTPDDVADPSHLNVEPPDYWARLFAAEGFTRDFSYDAGYLSSHAVLFRRGQLGVGDVVAGYEELLRNRQLVLERSEAQLRETLDTKDRTEEQRQAACAEHDALADRFNTLVVDHRRLVEERGELERRRIAEAAAAGREIDLLERGHSRLVLELAEKTEEATVASGELSALQATKVIRYTRRLRRAYGRLLRRHPAPSDDAPAGFVPESDLRERSYQTWIELYDTVDEFERSALRDHLMVMADRPLMSIILPVYNTPEPVLRRAIESVREQIYGTWELCIANDMSTDPMVAEVVDGYAEADPRIRVVHRTENGHIAASSNSALALASGRWIVPMDHDDELTPHAMAHVVLALAERPDVGMLYSDEDKIDLQGRRHSPNFKPDFDPLLLLGQNYPGHLVCYRHDLVKAVGGYREGFDGSQDWDLTLRISELLSAEQVVHVPRVLYHWRSHPGSTATGVSAKPYAALAGHKAVQEHLHREGRSGEVITNPVSGWHRVKWSLPNPAPKVSIIIPTRDGHLLPRCLESVFRLTAYPNYDVVVVDNESLGRATLEYLRGHEHLVKVIRDERPFNYSALNNVAVRRSDGDVVCLLNDDCEITSSEWLDELVGQVLQDGIGAVGAKLLYPDGRIQHAGVVLGLDGVAGHVYRLSDRMASGHGGRLHLPQKRSAVTAACMVVRRRAWEQVGGLDEENLPIAFNDVDLCLRLGEAGWSIVWTPFTEMIHHESVTRGADTGHRAEGFARECTYMKTRWAHDLRADPTYNPNLSLQSEGPEYAFPPRRAD